MKWPISGPQAGGAVLALGLLFPLFFQLHGAVYRSPAYPMLDSGGSAMNVPLPVSIIACTAGIVVLARYSETLLSMGIVTALLASMIFASGLAGDIETRKVLLIAQFALPAFGLILGQMVAARENALKVTAIGFLAVLLTIVPVQVVRSIGANLSELPHDLWLFSIYQNRQYVPVILVSAYLIWLFAYWKPSKVQITLAAVMGYYAAASFSALALLEVLVGIGLLFFATNRDRWAAGALLAAILSAGAFLTYNLNSPHLRHKYAFGGAGQYATPAGVAEMDKFLFPEGSLAANLPVGLQQRLQGWSAYWKASSHSTGVFLVGHATPPPRSEATSAHNYYLDVLYNFGVFALLPLLGLIAYTGAWLWRARNRMTLPLLGLTFVVAFILILDNNLKVPLRQPYPGIFAFFLWGILLSSLNGTSADTYQNLKAKQ